MPATSIGIGQVLFTPAKASFIRDVSSRTGLSAFVVAAWVLAEGGPQSNPLNIGPGRDYGSWKGAADATVKLIQTSGHYGGIRRAAKSGDADAQIAAIAASPWDAGHYKGAGASPSTPAGTLLRGTFARVAGNEIFDLPGAVGGAVSDAAGAVIEPVAGAIGDARRFLEEKLELALVYVLLTAGAGVLFVAGLQRATGAPGAAAKLLATRGRSAAVDEIPF